MEFDIMNQNSEARDEIMRRQIENKETHNFLNNYFNSPDANALFNPTGKESCSECLVRRTNLLLNATMDDDVMLALLPEIEDLSHASDKQKENIRLQCMYLRQAYLIALQNMNTITWK